MKATNLYDYRLTEKGKKQITLTSRKYLQGKFAIISISLF